MTESELIERYFLSQQSSSGIVLGIGDDAAVLDIPENKQLVVSTDTLVSNVHFFGKDKAEDIGYKALAVNLSDMAAMAAEPKWFTLSLTMPKLDEAWLNSFSTGFFQLANQYQVELIGGDLSLGPLSISITIHGLVDKGSFISRGGARVGDAIYVTGTLGDAGAAIELRSKSLDDSARDYFLDRLLKPSPRIELALALQEYVNSMIDISDGLVQDLDHILHASQVGATVLTNMIPMSNTLKTSATEEEAISLALSAGDDYELCFTADASYETLLNEQATMNNCMLTQIGTIDNSNQLKLLNQDGTEVILDKKGFQHFL